MPRPKKPKQATSTMLADLTTSVAELSAAKQMPAPNTTISIGKPSWSSIGRDTYAFFQIVDAWTARTGRTLPTGYSTWQWPRLLDWLIANVPLEGFDA